MESSSRATKMVMRSRADAMTTMPRIAATTRKLNSPS